MYKKSLPLQVKRKIHDPMRKRQHNKIKHRKHWFTWVNNIDMKQILGKAPKSTYSAQKCYLNFSFPHQPHTLGTSK